MGLGGQTYIFPLFLTIQFLWGVNPVFIDPSNSSCIISILIFGQIPENLDAELSEVKNNLENVDKFNSQYDSSIGNIVKRDVIDKYEYIDSSDSNEESRGWKNKEKKKKKFKKKNKKKNDRIENGEIEEEAFVTTSIRSTTTSESSNIEPNNQVQYSAYSSNPEPVYQHPFQSNPQPVYNPDEKKKYVYSIDYHGNEHYIDEDQLAALLRTPQAKKVRH